ncbi:MAG: pyrimidine/purine nucleoside phosphorylase [Gammaproteobacteria bacterium]|nr:pyrimidine/purine nucleoside phosphorylase [Gammaproteobacteria bacterium]
MEKFNNVSVVKQANIYFDGLVTSRTLLFSDGSRKTLGIMQPGEYQFSTEERELMEITAGELEVLLPGMGWQKISGGQSFEVAAEAEFQLKVSKTTDYCCSYLG